MADEHALSYIIEMMKKGVDHSEISSFLVSRGIEKDVITKLFKEAEKQIGEFSFAPELQKKINSAIFDVALLVLFLFSILFQALAAFMTLYLGGLFTTMAGVFGLAFGTISVHLLQKTGASTARILKLGLYIFPATLPLIILVPAVSMQALSGSIIDITFVYGAMITYYIAMNMPYSFMQSKVSSGELQDFAKHIVIGTVGLFSISIILHAILMVMF